MSMGAKMRTALLVLKDEGKLPPGIRTNELEKRIAEKLTELGCRPGEIPNRRTFLRHLDDLRGLLQPTDVTLCHFRDDAVIGMVGADNSEPPPTTKDDEMHSIDRRWLQDMTGASRKFLLTIPFDHPIDSVLRKEYLDPCYLMVRQADEIEVRAADFSWRLSFLVVSVSKSARTISTRLQMPPTFMLSSADRTPIHLIDLLQEADQLFQKGAITKGEYEERTSILQSLRDEQRYPSKWLAAKMIELNRALDAKLLTRLQHSNASQELHPVMDEAQVQEVSEIVLKAEASSAATEAPAVNGSADKPKKKPVATLVTATPPAEFGQLKVTSAPPEIRELPTKVVASDPLIKN